MASLWNAAAVALADPADPAPLDRFMERARRAPAAIARYARHVLAPVSGISPRLHLTTCSASGTVTVCLLDLAERYRLTVACAEGRPRYEGHAMARALAASGVAVELHTDAGVASALPRTSALVVGADAVGPASFVNKCGTGQLAAASAHRGVPVYVLAGQDKLASSPLDRRLGLRDGPGAEVWEKAPPGVRALNPYFERIPLELAVAVITDVGVLGVDLVATACEASERRTPPGPLLALLA